LFPFVRDTVQFALSGSNVSCRFDIQSDLWLCDIDKNQIGQVIDNIAINAKQAMPDGGTLEVFARNITLSANHYATLKPGRYVEIAIKDHGTGMPQEILQRIFDPFFTTKATGHGLGLATCYSIIKRHDGAIIVESEVGKGSTFHVFLPEAKGTMAEPMDKRTTLFKGSGTFIVMDDEEVMRDVISNMLESLGYSVVCSQNGRATIEFFEMESKSNRQISGAILDLTIPGGMGGKEAIQKLKEISPNTLFFAASGHTDDPIMSSPQEYGFSASISKPFRKSELTEMLEKHMMNK
jgi:CheY-like chemotaxis protein